MLLVLLYSGNYRLSKFEFTNANTESNLLWMPADTKFDLIISGASHARCFSRSGNHFRIENILNKKIANLSQGLGAGGIENQLLYLRYFLSRGNSTNEIVYFIDPFVFFNDKMDNNNYIYNNEPFNWSFIGSIVANSVRAETFNNYLKFKLKKHWWTFIPDTNQINTQSLEFVNPDVFEKRMRVMYPDGMTDEMKKIKWTALQKFLSLAGERKMKITFVVPPTLLGHLPYHETMLEELEVLCEKYFCNIYDYSIAMEAPQYYYDHDHLNTSGVVYFTEKYLRQVLK